MKTIKLILATLLMMVAFTVQAQEYVVQVYKDGKVVKEYPASEVANVEMKPDYGYYSFAANNYEEVKALTEDDFTKLTEATSEVPCGVAGWPVVLTEGTTAPTFATYSIAANAWSNDVEMKAGNAGTGTTKIINGKTYNVWYFGANTSASDDSKARFTIK